MRGVITTADVLKNPLLICREFGVRVLLRCVGAILLSRSVTFLEIAVQAGFKPATAIAAATVPVRSADRLQ
jgi:hypothetical protein